jgi:hypothetical protein
VVRTEAARLAAVTVLPASPGAAGTSDEARKSYQTVLSRWAQRGDIQPAKPLDP